MANRPQNQTDLFQFFYDIIKELELEQQDRQGRQVTYNNVFKKYKDSEHAPHVKNANIFGHFIRDNAILKQVQERVEASADTNNLLAAENEKLSKDLMKEKAKTQQIIDATLSKIAAMHVLSPNPVIRASKSKKSPSELVAGFSDAQIGSRITPDETFGISEYNFDIFKKRFQRYIEGIISIYEKESLDHNIERINVAMLGDNVEGETIYPGQGFYLDRMLIDQVYEGGQVVAKGLAELASAVNCPIECLCVDGNHGRPGMKGMNHLRTNWDFVFNKTVEAYLKDNKQISFQISASPTLILTIQDHIFALCHGDTIKGSLSIPFYGGEREKRGLQGMTALPIEYVFVGDKHRSAEFDVDYGQIIFNGCFPGGSQLSVNQMRQAGLPKQTLMNITKRFGLSGKYYVYLSDSKPVKLEQKGRMFTPVVEPLRG